MATLPTVRGTSVQSQDTVLSVHCGKQRVLEVVKHRHEGRHLPR